MQEIYDKLMALVEEFHMIDCTHIKNCDECPLSKEHYNLNDDICDTLSTFDIMKRRK